MNWKGQQEKPWLLAAGLLLLIVVMVDWAQERKESGVREEGEKERRRNEAQDRRETVVFGW